MGALRKLSPSIASSVVLHAALLTLWAISATQSMSTHSPRESKYIMVEVDPLPKSRSNADSTKNQVVQTEKATKSTKAAPDSFLGEQTQQVDRQIVSMPKTGTAAATSRR